MNNLDFLWPVTEISPPLLALVTHFFVSMGLPLPGHVWNSTIILVVLLAGPAHWPLLVTFLGAAEIVAIFTIGVTLTFESGGLLVVCTFTPTAI